MESTKLEPIVRLDNKVRLSSDVLSKAQAIADEWGLQNAKAAVEAVFRKYADDYMYGRQPQFNGVQPTYHLPQIHSVPIGFQPMGTDSPCPKSGIQPSDAASELDGLLGL